MKKQLLLLVMMLLPMVASADESGTCGDNLTWTLVESTGTLTISGSGAMENYTAINLIPWYSYRANILAVVIEDGVTSIGDNAYWGCSNLTSVTIPNSLTSIGNRAFRNCSNLTSFTIPNCVVSIGNTVFQDCTGLTSVTIGNNVTSIGEYVFYRCSSLISVIIGNSVTSIGSYAFYQCSGLTSVTIPNSVTSIGNSAFQGCSCLTSVTIPNSVTSIGISAFYGCSSLTSITIPTSVTSIGRDAFSCSSVLTSIAVTDGNIVYDSRGNCNAIIQTQNNTLILGCKNTLIPNSVTSIGDNAFQNCSSLNSISIPNSVTSIGVYAFQNCSGLTSITIPNSVTSIGSYAFSGCKLENVLTYNSKTNCSKAFSDRTYQHAMLYIPEGTWGEAVYDGDWYMFNNIRETVMNTDNLSPSRIYTLMDTKTFSYAVYDGTNDDVKMMKAFYSIDEQDLNNCWQVITQADKKYLYNLGAKKYATISADGRIMLTANKTAIEVKEGDGSIILGTDTSHQWGFVKNDSQSVVTGITPQTSISEQTANKYYSLDGQCTQSPRRGMNIVRKSDGSIIKVVVK